MKNKLKIYQYIPFVSVHIGCLFAIWTGWSVFSIFVCVFLYVIRALALTAGFHRYFAHQSYQTSRLFQFFIALIGTSAGQMGPLWWASHHKVHHRFSDRDEDVHSPVTKSFSYAHFGWILEKKNRKTQIELIPEFAKYPELVFLNKFYWLPPLLLGASLYLVGGYLETISPTLNTSGPQLLIWGFFISTVALYHATFSINSLGHRWGSRAFETQDNSRNNVLLALMTMGEGWHNNHHRYPQSARQGFLWWQIDPTYWLLKSLDFLGIVSNLKLPLKSLQNTNQKSQTKI